MIASEYKDLDGFKLQFEEKCSESEKKFYVSKFPKLDAVATQKLHCTTCDVHIGTAPIAEKIIRTHQVLGVTQCNKCFAFYNSGEFGKGEDGSEYYCRWCGQGGEVFCCSSCPYVFCNKCIKSNLFQSYVKEIEENDDWLCFVCNKEILKNHRATHWALRNFMNKQLEKIQKTNVNSEDELNNLLNEDLSNCCPRKKRKPFARPTPAPVKRPNGGFLTVQPPPKKQYIANQAPKVIKINTPPAPKTAPKSYPAKVNSEIVCTPDIMGLFSDNDEPSATKDTPAPMVAPAPPPPLVLRNNQKSLRPIAPSPIFHNVNGFQIDLNHASRQEIFRLPNGKLIQVRKQTAAPPQIPGFRPPMINNRPPQFTIRQAAPPAFSPMQRMNRVGAMTNVRARPNQPHQRFTFESGRVVATPPVPAAATAQVPPNSTSTIFTQQNGSISVARAPQPNTPFGGAKTEFEDKIINGMEICQHTINKMITLTNSTSFKSSNTFSDLKELYIHLQYLFSYTAGKFKLLQESLTTGMESLAKFEVPKDNDDDELTIVEQTTELIEVLSDDEEEVVTKPKEVIQEVVAVKKPIIKHIQYVPKDKPEVVDASAAATALAVASIVDPVQIDIDQELEESSEPMDVDLLKAKDKKLTNKVVVKVEKLEESKNPIIKLFFKKLLEKVETESCRSSSSREATPELLFNVPLDIPAENSEVFDKEPTAVDLEANKENVVDDEQSNDELDFLNENKSSTAVKESDVGVKDDDTVLKESDDVADKDNMNADNAADKTEKPAVVESAGEESSNAGTVDPTKTEVSNETENPTDVESANEESSSIKTIDASKIEESTKIQLESVKETESILKIDLTPPAELLEDEPEEPIESKTDEVSSKNTTGAKDPLEQAPTSSEEPVKTVSEHDSSIEFFDVTDEVIDLDSSIDTSSHALKENSEVKKTNENETENMMETNDIASPPDCNEIDFWATACDEVNAANSTEPVKNPLDDSLIHPVDEVTKFSENDIETFDSLLMSRIEDQERQNGSRMDVVE